MRKRWIFVVVAVLLVAIIVNSAMGEVKKVHISVETQGNTSIIKFVDGTTVYMAKVKGVLRDGMATVMLKGGKVVAVIQDGKPYEVLSSSKNTTMEGFAWVKP